MKLFQDIKLKYEIDPYSIIYLKDRILFQDIKLKYEIDPYSFYLKDRILFSIKS